MPASNQQDAGSQTTEQSSWRYQASFETAAAVVKCKVIQVRPLAAQLCSTPYCEDQAQGTILDVLWHAAVWAEQCPGQAGRQQVARVLGQRACGIHTVRQTATQHILQHLQQASMCEAS